MHIYCWLVLLIYYALFLDAKTVTVKLDNFLIIYTVFINDQDAGIECTLNKVAGDTKLGGAMDSLEGRELSMDYRAGQSPL